MENVPAEVDHRVWRLRRWGGRGGEWVDLRSPLEELFFAKMKEDVDARCGNMYAVEREPRRIWQESDTLRARSHMLSMDQTVVRKMKCIQGHCRARGAARIEGIQHGR